MVKMRNQSTRSTDNPLLRHLLAGLGISSLLILGACGGGGDVVAVDDDVEEDVVDDGGDDQADRVAIAGHSSTLAITSDDRLLVVANKEADSVSVIEVRTPNGGDSQTLLAELPVGQEPHFVAIDSQDRFAYVSNAVDGTVSVIDLTTNPPSVAGDPIAVGTEPRGLALTPNDRYLYVANHTAGNLSVIRTSSLAVVNTVTTGGNPMTLAVTDDGDDDDLDETVYAPRFFSEVIDPVNRPDGFNDAKQGLVDTVTVAESLEDAPVVGQLVVDPIADAGFAADRRQFCLATRTELQNLGEVVLFNSGVDGAGDGAAALANEVYCPDPASADASADGPLGSVPQGAYPNQLYASIIRNGTLYIPNTGASPEPPVRFNLNIQALVSGLLLDGSAQQTINLNDQIKTEIQPAEEAGSLERLFANDIVAIDANAEGTQFLLVSRGGNYVMRATSDGAGGPLSINAPDNVVRYQTGNTPTGVVLSADGRRAYTNNEVNTSVTAIDLETDQVLARDIESSVPPAPGTVAHRDLLGKLVFYTALGVPDTHDTDGDGQFDIALRDIDPLFERGKASDNAWSSCASCHNDGLTDNVTWIFPTGPRQSVSLEGTFARGNPADQRVLNWNGVRGSVTDFNNNSRGVQGGVGHATDVNGVDRTAEVFNHGLTGGISDALDAMTEWVANEVRAYNMPQDVATEIQLTDGRATFASHCASCHGGAKWTKSTITRYQNNPTFAGNPLAANFFAEGREPALDPNLQVGGPQIIAAGDFRFLDAVGTLDTDRPTEIRGAGAIGGGAISIPGDPNEGVEVARQSTQGFAPLGGAGFNAPSLLGVAYHSPYLHDGSAPSLDEVFAVHTLPEQGDLTINDVVVGDEERESLRQFLLSIDDQTEAFPEP